MIPSFDIACDTETGGLYPAVNPLLSIAAVSSESQADPFLVYVDPASQPGTWIEPEAARVNGYTPELWKQRGEVPLNEAMGQFRDWLAREKGKGGRIVCHNLAFDRGFLMEAERITGIELPGRYDWRCSLLEMASQMDRGLLKARKCSLDWLGDLSGFWKKEERAAKHDALQDARACLHGWEWLQGRKAEEPEKNRHAVFGCLIWEWIEGQGGEFCWREDSEEILPIAERAGLCRRVIYDPVLHGEAIEAEPGDEIWFWGKEGEV